MSVPAAMPTYFLITFITNPGQKVGISIVAKEKDKNTVNHFSALNHYRATSFVIFWVVSSNKQVDSSRHLLS